MKFLTTSQPVAWPAFAWSIVVLLGLVAPVIALLVLAGERASFGTVSAPILALSLMVVSMIAAAAAGRMRTGILLAMASGTCLIVLASALGMTPLADPVLFSIAVIVASISFAVRGVLFVCSARDKGWIVALMVVAGEAAILITAAIDPELWPDWVLVLLPAQWTSSALQASLTGAGPFAASSVLIALAGTAAATLLVVRLWPRRWTYLVMFTTWIGLSALVWFWPSASIFGAFG